MGELGDRVEEIRDMDINSRIPSGVIHSLNNTIMDSEYDSCRTPKSTNR